MSMTPASDMAPSIVTVIPFAVGMVLFADVPLRERSDRVQAMGLVGYGYPSRQTVSLAVENR